MLSLIWRNADRQHLFVGVDSCLLFWAAAKRVIFSNFDSKRGHPSKGLFR